MLRKIAEFPTLELIQTSVPPAAGNACGPQCFSGLMQVLGCMIKIQQLRNTRKVRFGQVPNPWGSVPQDLQQASPIDAARLELPPQTVAKGLGVLWRSNVKRILDVSRVKHRCQLHLMPDNTMDGASG
jgi:hypothetical protein